LKACTALPKCKESFYHKHKYIHNIHQGIHYDKRLTILRDHTHQQYVQLKNLMMNIQRM
jgi:hypothetical protein